MTPTGALIVTSYATSFGPVPAMTIERVGYGAGDRDNPGTPNVLRVLIGRAADRPRGERVVVIECEIDDMNPQLFGVGDGPAVRGRRARGVLRAGADEEEPARHAADGRCAAGAARRRCRTSIFRETTTIGLRYHEVERECLEREIVTVDTPLGAVRFKVAWRDGRVVNAVPGVRGLRAHRGGEQSVREGSAGHRRPGLRQPASERPVVSRFYITTPIYYINAEPHLGPRVHDDGGRRRGAGASPAGRRRVLPDRHRRARPEGRAGGPEGRADAERSSPIASRSKFRDLLPRAQHLERRLHPDDRAAALRGLAGAVAPRPRSRLHLQGQVRRLVLHRRRGVRPRDAAAGRPLSDLRQRRSSGSRRRATSSSCRRFSSRCSITTGATRIS